MGADSWVDNLHLTLWHHCSQVKQMDHINRLMEKAAKARAVPRMPRGVAGRVRVVETVRSAWIWGGHSSFLRFPVEATSGWLKPHGLGKRHCPLIHVYAPPRSHRLSN